MDIQDNGATFDVVCGDPAAYFATPQAIVDDATLTRAEKLQLLEEWALDLASRNTAADEGMALDTAAPMDHDAQMAAAVTEAHAIVKDGADHQIASLPARLWNRLIGAAT